VTANVVKFYQSQQQQRQASLDNGDTAAATATAVALDDDKDAINEAVRAYACTLTAECCDLAHWHGKLNALHCWGNVLKQYEQLRHQICHKVQPNVDVIVRSRATTTTTTPTDTNQTNPQSTTTVQQQPQEKKEKLHQPKVHSYYHYSVTVTTTAQQEQQVVPTKKVETMEHDPHLEFKVKKEEEEEEECRDDGTTTSSGIEIMLDVFSSTPPGGCGRFLVCDELFGRRREI
jgi:hypothetical protein